MKTPWELLKESKTKIKTTWRIAFVSALVLGLLIHLPVMLSDIPNHDGLSSMYFDQNMITSGRWFLTVACGFSSYFTIPWVIGLIGLIWLALTAAVLTEVLELTDPVTITVVSGLLVSFPALASTFAYVFTMDGYMLALFLAVLFQLSQIQHQRSHLHVVVDHGLVAGILNSLAEQCGQAGSVFHRQIVGTSLAAAYFLHIVDNGKFNIVRLYLL